MTLRIVIANQSEARFLDTLGSMRKLVPAGTLRNPSARLHERELVSDRAGRMFNGGSERFHHRGGLARHAANSERSMHQHVVERFARLVGVELGRAHAAGRFDRLVLVAAPAFLGRLRRTLPAQLRAHLAATVAKDLVNHPDDDVRAYLPGGVYSGGVGFQAVKRSPHAAA